MIFGEKKSILTFFSFKICQIGLKNQSHDFFFFPKVEFLQFFHDIFSQFFRNFFSRNFTRFFFTIFFEIFFHNFFFKILLNNFFHDFWTKKGVWVQFVAKKRKITSSKSNSNIFVSLLFSRRCTSVRTFAYLININ